MGFGQKQIVAINQGEQFFYAIHQLDLELQYQFIFRRSKGSKSCCLFRLWEIRGVDASHDGGGGGKKRKRAEIGLKGGCSLAENVSDSLITEERGQAFLNFTKDAAVLRT